MTFLNTTYRAYRVAVSRPAVVASRLRKWPRGYGLIFAIASSGLAWAGVAKAVAMVAGLR
jgi:hypothetical protein